MTKYPFKVSVIVPSYNRAHLLARTLPTYLQEEVGELLLIDDCSEDDTQKVVSNLQKEYPQIRYLKNETNSGQAFCKNKAIKCAQGEYIYFGDDDSVLMEGSIKKLLYAVEKAGFDAAGARALYMGNYCPTDDKSIAVFERWMRNRKTLPADKIAMLSPFESHFDSYTGKYARVAYLPACLLISSVNAKRLLFDTGYTGCAYREETDFCIRATLCGLALVYVPDAVQVNFPKTLVGSTGARKNGSNAWIESALSCNRRFFEKNWDTLSQKFNLSVKKEEIILQSEKDIIRIDMNKKDSCGKEFLKKIYFNIFVRKRYAGRVEKKKAVIVSFFGTSNAGGVERVSQYIYEILRHDYDVKILTKLNFTFPKFDYFFQAIIICIKLLFMKKDLVVGNSWQAFLYPCDVSFSHGTMEEYIRKAFGTFKRFSGDGFISFMEKTAARKSKKVLAVSSHVKNELISLYKIKPEKISVLPNCVDDELYSFSEKHNFREKTLLFSGRLENSKGLQYLKSLTDYIEKIDGWKLLVACNSRMNEELFQYNEKTEIYFNVSFSDMPEFYKQGSVLFFPSLYEGFSMATLEALSCGIPVIGTSAVVTSELSRFNFCRDISEIISNPAEIIVAADEMILKWGNKKKEMHEIIVHEFGKEQYAKKFLHEISALSGENL